MQPDLGVNVIGPKIGMQYNLGYEAPRSRRTESPPFQPSWEVVVGGTAGAKNVVERRDPLARANFAAFNTTVAAQRQFYRFGKVAGGADATYDGATGARMDGIDRKWRAGAAQRWSLGLYGGYEHIIGRFSALMQVGDSVARGYPGSRRLYSRYGWRYHVSDRVWSTMAIRSHGLWRANVLEFGVGYRLHLSPTSRS